MPYTRISVGPDIYEQYQKQISVILQQCLEEHFDVPSQDCFQIFEVHNAQQKVFDNYYPNLTNGRSNSGVLFHIFAGKQRNHDQKRALYKALAEHIEKTTTINREDIMVLINFNNAEDWSFSSGLSWKDETRSLK